MFSRTVRPAKGCGIWNERASPLRQRCSGGKWVMSSPANTTRPPSGGTVPVAMPNSVVLPAPLGPISAVMRPRGAVSDTPLTASRPPKRRDTLCTASRDSAMAGLLRNGSRSGPAEALA